MEKYEIFKRKVNYYETDKMQVVHHSNYIRYLEECRMDLLRQMDLDYEKIEAKGIMIPVLGVECSYLSTGRFCDTICIVSKIEKFHGLKFDVSYCIYSEDFTVLHNKAASSHCFVDFDFKPIRLKRDYPEIYEKMKEMAGVELAHIECW